MLLTTHRELESQVLFLAPMAYAHGQRHQPAWIKPRGSFPPFISPSCDTNPYEDGVSHCDGTIWVHPKCVLSVISGDGPAWRDGVGHHCSAHTACVSRLTPGCSNGLYVCLSLRSDHKRVPLATSREPGMRLDSCRYLKTVC